jgi:NhaC family Na+:H+ antiporter
MKTDSNLRIPFIGAIAPIFLLILMLSINVYLFGEDSSYGYNQIALLLSGLIASFIGMKYGFSWDNIVKGIVDNISGSMKAILILLMIGALSGTWLISGIVPAMIYYGLEILQPSYFLFAACIICALISISIGSSWSTVATVGIALLAIGKVLGISEGWIAGAIISGAYFGDKMSPLSDTTNLAPAMAGTDLFSHIRYMTYTTIPTFVISILVFLIYGFSIDGNVDLSNLQSVQAEVASTFNINGFLFLAPVFVVYLIYKKVDSILTLFLAAILGGVLAVIFQPEIIARLGDGIANAAVMNYKVIFQAMATDVAISSENPIVSKLLQSGGMSGMLNTVWLILCAMFFSGTIEATGILKIISNTILKFAKSRPSLVGSTVFSCIFFNITASDQYLAVVVPGKMFAEAYKDKGLHPVNLSRTLEDSGTVTSVLIPWNTCGVAQSKILGVGTLAYIPYCIFNWLSPIMTIIFAVFAIKIKELKQKNG